MRCLAGVRFLIKIDIFPDFNVRWSLLILTLHCVIHKFCHVNVYFIELYHFGYYKWLIQSCWFWACVAHVIKSKDIMDGRRKKTALLSYLFYFLIRPMGIFEPDFSNYYSIRKFYICLTTMEKYKRVVEKYLKHTPLNVQNNQFLEAGGGMGNNAGTRIWHTKGRWKKVKSKLLSKFNG